MPGACYPLLRLVAPASTVATIARGELWLMTGIRRCDYVDPAASSGAGASGRAANAGTCCNACYAGPHSSADARDTPGSRRHSRYSPQH